MATSLSASAFAQMRGAAPPPPPSAAARPAPTQAPSAPVARPGPVNPLAITANFKLETDKILGYHGLDPEDADAVTEFMAYVVTINCPDKNYDSPAYERPGWARIEAMQGPSSGEYRLVFGGWHRITHKQVSRIWNWDVQAGEARNLFDMWTENLQPNDMDKANTLELSLVVQWVGEKPKRLRRAKALSEGTANPDLAKTTGVEHDTGAPRKKRGFGAVWDFMTGADGTD